MAVAGIQLETAESSRQTPASTLFAVEAEAEGQELQPDQLQIDS